MDKYITKVYKETKQFVSINAFSGTVQFEHLLCAQVGSEIFVQIMEGS